MNAEQIEQFTLDNFDRSVMEFSKADYAELLGNLIDQLQTRLDCVEAELKAEGEDDSR